MNAFSETTMAMGDGAAAVSAFEDGGAFAQEIFGETVAFEPTPGFGPAAALIEEDQLPVPSDWKEAGNEYAGEQEQETESASDSKADGESEEKKATEAAEEEKRRASMKPQKRNARRNGRLPSRQKELGSRICLPVWSP